MQSHALSAIALTRLLTQRMGITMGAKDRLNHP